MKGVKKQCFGLLLLLSIMVGLSLNVSSDVSALKHEINTIPIANYGGTLSSHSISWSSDFVQDLDVTSPRLFGSFYNNGSCTYYRNAWDYSYSNGSIGFWSYPDISFNVEYSPYSTITGIGSPFCRQLSPFDSSSLSSLGSSLPQYVFGSPDFRSMLPYYYDYDAYTLASHHVDSSSGMTYSYRFKFSDVWGVPPNKFRSMTIPLSFVDPDKVGSLSSGRSVSVKGSFDFSGPGNIFSFSDDFINNGHFNLVFNGYVSGSGVSSDTFACSSNLISLEFNDLLQLDFTCSGTLSHNYDYGGLTLSIYTNTSGSTYVWDTNADYYFSLAYFITDNDDTPGVTLSDPVSGNNQNLSPAGKYFSAVSSSDGDFFSSLTSMFSFNTFNPFLPIYNLFSSSDNCAQIPTLAGMLHSNETQVCPWFSHDTRRIVTPVIGLSSMMIIFGFFIRWLGSSSGNFFEDSSGETLTYSNWYTDGRGFHRTQGSKNRRINK